VSTWPTRPREETTNKLGAPLASPNVPRDCLVAGVSVSYMLASSLSTLIIDDVCRSDLETEFAPLDAP
jgi:hypothetical protein